MKGGHKEMYVEMMGHLMKKLYKKGGKKPEGDGPKAAAGVEEPSIDEENPMAEDAVSNESEVHEANEMVPKKKKKPKSKFGGTIVLAMGGKKGK